MSSYDNFRERNLFNKTIEDAVINSFIFEGNSAIKVTVANEELDAAIVNRQERDSAYIYFPAIHNVPVGAFVYAKGLYFLLIEEIKIIKNIDFKKYTALICNIELENEIWGYFKGPEETYINLSLKEDSAVVSQQKPILVVPQGIVDVGNKIVIKERPWLIIESDIASNNYIGYYSLQATTISKTEEEIAGTAILNADLINIYTLSPQTPITMITESGYFKTDKKVNIIKLNKTSVIFEVPYGIEKIMITRKENGQIVQQEYKVVL